MGKESKNGFYQLTIYLEEKARGSHEIGPEMKQTLQSLGYTNEKGDFVLQKYESGKLFQDLEKRFKELSVEDRVWLFDVKARYEKNSYICIEAFKKK